MSLFTEQVILRTHGDVVGESRYGVPERAPDEDVAWRAWYEPQASSELLAAAEQYIDVYRLLLPLDAPRGWDVVVLPHDGEEYQVIGRPGHQPSGFIVEGYLDMLIERVTG